MAIPCGACGQPVHEQVVICPHCAEETGVGPDPIAAAEIALHHQPSPTPPVRDHDPVGDRVEIQIDQAFGGALDYIAPTPETTLPRAIARERRRAPSVDDEKDD